MACGRLKNLEIAARNPLCGHGDRRRHSPTTGKVAGEGETPSQRQWANPGLRARTSPAPPARRKLRATRRGGNPGPPGKGRLRGLWPRGSPAPSGKGETPNHLGKGKTLGQLAEGKPRAMRRKEALSHLGKGENFEPPGLGGNPGSFGEKKALSHRHGNYLESFGLGETPSYPAKSIS